MKIEVILTDDINETCTSGTCFEASESTKKRLSSKQINCVKGLIIIDDKVNKFNFNPLGMDGDIFAINENYRIFIKYFIPIYFANLYLVFTLLIF